MSGVGAGTFFCPAFPTWADAGRSAVCSWADEPGVVGFAGFGAGAGPAFSDVAPEAEGFTCGIEPDGGDVGTRGPAGRTVGAGVTGGGATDLTTGADVGAIGGEGVRFTGGLAGIAGGGDATGPPAPAPHADRETTRTAALSAPNTNRLIPSPGARMAPV